MYSHARRYQGRNCSTKIWCKSVYNKLTENPNLFHLKLVENNPFERKRNWVLKAFRKPWRLHDDYTIYQKLQVQNVYSSVWILKGGIHPYKIQERIIRHATSRTLTHYLYTRTLKDLLFLSEILHRRTKTKPRNLVQIIQNQHSNH